MNKKEFLNQLTNQIIPFWNNLKDEDNGGFYGYVSPDLKVDPKGEKGVILNNRILWFYSSAYTLLKDEKLLEMADHAYRFLVEHCFDSRYGGVFWSLSYDGIPLDETKHTYNQAFAIYALSAYYEASGRKDALNMAYTLYHTIEDKCKDDFGYLEAFNRNFTPASNEKLSENGVMAGRTMNTLLHVMEAYTELYRVDSFYEVGDSIRWILKLFKDKIYNKEEKSCDVFFDMDYNSLIDLRSYGHDIEASWLIDRASEVLNDKAYFEEMRTVNAGLAESTYANGYDSKQKALCSECENGKVDTTKIWWVQAESVIGYYNAYTKNPEKTEYLQVAEDIWGFINDVVIDKRCGEWFENVDINNNAESDRGMVHPWKCPYHNGRMCIEMIKRLDD